MKSLMINSGKEYFTFLDELFSEIEGFQKNYNWLISNCEYYPQNEDYAKIFDKSYCWISGEELTDIVIKEKIQWIWGVFLGFPKDIEESKALSYGVPIIPDDSIWGDNPIIQNPLAEMEIVAWDSSATIVISNYDCVIDTLRKNNPYARPLV